jgi:hypothetical protein
MNTVEDYCQGNAEPLRQFFEEVFKYEFDSKPNYNYLRGILLALSMEGLQ